MAEPRKSEEKRERVVELRGEGNLMGLAVMPRSLPEVIDLAERVAKSGVIPEAFRGKSGDILVAMIMGMEVGLKPLQALQSIAVINGRPSIWGDGARGLVMASGLVESIDESDPAEVMRSGKARCEIKRKGVTGTFIGEFGKTDAERAGLLNKDNYRRYPAQMFSWRAFHQAARKGFPDIYRGLSAAEEIIDITPEPARTEQEVEEQLKKDFKTDFDDVEIVPDKTKHGPGGGPDAVAGDHTTPKSDAGQPPPEQDRPITKGEMRSIEDMAESLGINDERFQQLCEQVGAPSLKGMLASQGGRLVDLMQAEQR